MSTLDMVSPLSVTSLIKAGVAPTAGGGFNAALLAATFNARGKTVRVTFSFPQAACDNAGPSTTVWPAYVPSAFRPATAQYVMGAFSDNPGDHTIPVRVTVGTNGDFTVTRAIVPAVLATTYEFQLTMQWETA